MSGPAIVWLVIGLRTTIVVLALMIALVRHLLVLGRSLRRFRDEVQPVAEEISTQGQRASTRSSGLSRERPFGRS